MNTQESFHAIKYKVTQKKKKFLYYKYISKHVSKVTQKNIKFRYNNKKKYVFISFILFWWLWECFHWFFVEEERINIFRFGDLFIPTSNVWILLTPIFIKGKTES